MAALLLAVLLPVMPASARPMRASRPMRSSLAHKLSIRPLAVDDDFPGVALPGSPFTDSLDENSDVDDIFQVHLEVGQTLEATITGPVGTQFYADIFNSTNPETGWVGASLNPFSEDGEGYPQSVSYTAGTAGTVYLDVWSNGGSGAYDCTWSVVDPPLSMKRLAGTSRYLTGLAISREWADGSSPTVIIATGSNFADALAASALAGSYDCPILLTTPTTLLPGITTEINRLRGGAAAKAFIVGSEKAVYPAVATALTNAGVTVERLGGATRYETAVKIGAEVKRHETVDLGHPWSGDAWIVKGNDFPDALAAAPIAAARKMPILLVLPTAIPSPTSNAISSLSISHAYVTGSNLAISDYVAGHLGVPATRIAGAAGTGRYGTAAAIATYAVDHGWASPATVGLSTGSNFPDALGGGALVGKMGGVLLLVNPADYNPDLEPPADAPAWWAWVYDHQTSVTGNMRAFGSNVAISDWVFSDFLYALQP